MTKKQIKVEFQRIGADVHFRDSRDDAVLDVRVNDAKAGRFEIVGAIRKMDVIDIDPVNHCLVMEVDGGVRIQCFMVEGEWVATSWDPDSWMSLEDWLDVNVPADTAYKGRERRHKPRPA